MARGRNVINQSIALEGGDEIVAMLRRMGEEGETAARKLEAAFRNVNVGKSFGSAFANLKSQFASLQAAGSKVADSFGRVAKSLRNVSGAFQSSTARIGIFTASLTGAAYGAGVFLKGSLDSLGQLNDLSESLGIASEDLQAFQYAGVQAGVGAGDFVKAIASLSDTLNQSDRVMIKRIAKNRLLGARRCPWRINQPAAVRPVVLAANGALSTNEA